MSFVIKLTIPDNIIAVPEKIEAGMKQATKDSTILVNKAAIGYAPRKFGTLKRSIRSEVASFMGTVIQDAEVANYGAFVNNGTGIYGPLNTPIVPKTKPFLQWKGSNGWYRAKSVKGMKARPFMEPALLDNQENINQIFQTMIDEAIGGD